MGSNAAADPETQGEPGWDQLAVGLRVGPLTYVVTQAMVTAFCEAMPFEREPYLEGALNAGGVMPPTMLATDYIPLLKGHLHLGWGLMSRHSIRSLKPVEIGDTVTVAGVITDKFEKKGRHYWTLEYHVSNASGDRCLESTITCSVD